ncbi:hypothetical protein PTKIN_Ptkin13bG0162600 [Pterospermum kingtungense]
MLTVGSGFGWSDVDKCIIATKDVFDDWVKTHSYAKGLRNKSFPHYDDFAIIFGKDRATRAGAESVADFVNAIDAADFDDFVYADDFDDATTTDLDGIEILSIGAISRRRGSTKRTKSDDGSNELIQYLDNFQTTYQEGMNEFTTYLRKK